MHQTPLDPETEALITDVLSEKTSRSECFFALQVTNEVKERGRVMIPPAGIGRHRDMAPFIRDLLATPMLAGYEAVLVPVENGQAEALLYCPVGTPDSVLEQYHNLVVQPVKPVDAPARAVAAQTSAALATPTPAQVPNGVLTQHLQLPSSTGHSRG